MNFADLKIGMRVQTRPGADEHLEGEVVDLDADVELARIAWDDDHPEDADWYSVHALCALGEP